MSAPQAPSGSPDNSKPGWPTALIVVVALTLSLRLVLASQLHLAEDEAYYRLWSLHPALGAYDHPPMIAWWIWLGRQLLGGTNLGVRLLPILASATTSFLTFDVARLCGFDRALATRAGLWFNAMFLVLGGGFLAVPDAAAALFWVASLWASLRALRTQSLAWWGVAGVMGGLAALSKYSALFLAPGMMLWMVTTPHGRQALRRPGLWLAVLLAAGLFGLNVEWNAQHHWLTFAKQFGRIAPRAWAPEHLPEFVLLQVVLINPLIALFAVRGLVSRQTRAIWPLIATSAPFVVYLLIHSLHDRVQAHWPAPIYPAIAICAAVGASQVQGLLQKIRGGVSGLPIGVLGLATWALIAFPSQTLGPYDPLRPLRSWPSFAGDLERLRQTHAAAWIGTTSYGLAAQLADQSEIRPPVIQITERARYSPAPAPLSSQLRQPGLVIDLARRVDVAALRKCFVGVVPLGHLVRGVPRLKSNDYVVVKVWDPVRDLVSLGCP